MKYQVFDSMKNQVKKIKKPSDTRSGKDRIEPEVDIPVRMSKPGRSIRNRFVETLKISTLIKILKNV